MANLGSTVSRVVLNITSAAPTESWPNFGSVMHNAWLGKVTGLGTELGAAAGITPPFHGTDIPTGGGVKQNLAMFTFSRYSRHYTYAKTGNTWIGPGGGENGTNYRDEYAYYAHVTEHVVTHVPDTNSNVVGIGIDWFSVNRASSHHESYGGAHISARVVYRTADAPSSNKSINYGKLGSMGEIFGGQGNTHQHHSREITAPNPIIYVQLIVRVAHGMQVWHDSGDRSPRNWSPDVAICNNLHPVGINANFARSISNQWIGATAFTDYRTLYYRPNAQQLQPPRKILQPHSIEAGNGNWYYSSRYRMPYWGSNMP